MPLDYQRIKRQLELPETRLRGLFEEYCADCSSCTSKLEWSCKVAPGRLKHDDRFVHVSSTRDKETWFGAGERLLRRLLGDAATAETTATMEALSIHAKQLFVGYSGPFGGARDEERIKLYFSLAGEAAGLWSWAKALIGRSSLDVRAPTLSAWLLVFVLDGRRSPLHRVDLVYDRLEFRDPGLLRELGSFLHPWEIDFIAGEARGIVSLRQAEPEKVYAFVEPANEGSPLRALARRRGAALPLLLEGLDQLTWIGVSRGDRRNVENDTLTLYVKIRGEPRPNG